MKRGLLLALLLLATAGCKDRKSFDQRYSDTARSIDEKAMNLDSQLNESNAQTNQLDNKY